MNLVELLAKQLAPFGLSPQDLIVAMAGTAAALTVAAIWYGLILRDPLAARAKALTARRNALKSGYSTPRRNAQRRVSGFNLMQVVVGRLNLLRSRQADRTALLLARAGWRSKDALIIFLFFKACLPLAVGGAAVVVLYLLNLFPIPGMGKMSISLTATLIGAYLPDLFVKNAIKHREQKIRKALPDALDLMVICAEAGLTLDASLNRVARELSQSSIELADELSLTALELGFLPERHKAVENLGKRADLPEVRGIVNTLLQTERYGTPLAQSLRVLSNEYRNERLLRAEEKAARLPATMTVPMILFILPALFIVLGGPAMLRVIDALSKSF